MHRRRKRKIGVWKEADEDGTGRKVVENEEGYEEESASRGEQLILNVDHWLYVRQRHFSGSSLSCHASVNIYTACGRLESLWSMKTIM